MKSEIHDIDEEGKVQALGLEDIASLYDYPLDAFQVPSSSGTSFCV